MSLRRSTDHKIVDKPWGKEVIWALTQHYAAKLLIIEPNKRLSLQYHNQKTETIMVVHGTLIIEQGSDVDPLILEAGDSFHVEPHTIHRFGAANQQVTLVEVSTLELDDVIRLEDDHGR